MYLPPYLPPFPITPLPKELMEIYTVAPVEGKSDEIIALK